MLLDTYLLRRVYPKNTSNSYVAVILYITKTSTSRAYFFYSLGLVRMTVSWFVIYLQQCYSELIPSVIVFELGSITNFNGETVSLLLSCFQKNHAGINVLHLKLGCTCVQRQNLDSMINFYAKGGGLCGAGGLRPSTVRRTPVYLTGPQPQRCTSLADTKPVTVAFYHLPYRS